jgi:4,5-dihydroxyphthalate decarboxylase
MSDIGIRLGCRPYDTLSSLFIGLIETPGINLQCRALKDIGNARNALLQEGPDALEAAEMSFNRYVGDHANGNTDILGLPAFIVRSFRHRYWFVRADSPFETFADIAGSRVGTDSWNDTGTLWARAAMRDAGVDIADVHWKLGPVNPTVVSKPKFATDSVPKSAFTELEAGDFQIEALREKRIDVLTTAHTPDSVYLEGGEFRRLLRNYGDVERDYHRRRGYRPVMHIVAMRRSFAMEHPQAVRALYEALKASWVMWWERFKRFPEATPWASEGVATFLRDFSQEIPPYGTATSAHQRMLADMCSEQYEQGIVASPADPKKLFADFEAIMSESAARR